MGIRSDLYRCVHCAALGLLAPELRGLVGYLSAFGRRVRGHRQQSLRRKKSKKVLARVVSCVAPQQRGQDVPRRVCQRLPRYGLHGRRADPISRQESEIGCLYKIQMPSVFGFFGLNFKFLFTCVKRRCLLRNDFGILVFKRVNSKLPFRSVFFKICCHFSENVV